MIAPESHAGQRHFAYSYETVTAPKGSIEFENWVTLKRPENDHGDRYNLFQFRHEIEFGVTDRFQLALYVADWEYSEEAGHGRYQDTAFEAINSFTNPTTDFLGSAIYGEVKVGEDFVELEGKLLLQKNFGPVIVVYNATIEAEWEGEGLHEDNGEFQQSVGIAYSLNQNFSVGGELVNEIEFPDWDEAGDSIVFLGPNVSARLGRTFATVAALWQVTDVDEEPDFQTRLIFGIEF